MTFRIFETTWRGHPCLKGLAVINPSKKLGIEKRIQRSWIARGEIFAVKREEVEKAFTAQALRWEQQTMERIKSGEQPELKQEEIKV